MASKFFTLMLIMLMLAQTCLIGCNSGSVAPIEQENAGDEDPSTMSESFGDGTVYPFSGEDPYTGNPIVGTVYLYGSLHGGQEITKLASNRTVMSEFTRLGSLGYVYAAEGSKLTECSVEIPVDSGIAEYQSVVFAFEDPDDTSRFAFVNYGRVDNYACIVQSGELKIGSEPEDSMFYNISSDGLEVWAKEYPPAWLTSGDEPCLAGAADFSIAADPNLNFWKWMKCVAIGTVAGCFGSALVCLITTVGWPVCEAAGCLGSALTAEVGCFLWQVWGDD